jgi:hypothetical protein
MDFLVQGKGNKGIFGEMENGHFVSYKTEL